MLLVSFLFFARESLTGEQSLSMLIRALRIVMERSSTKARHRQQDDDLHDHEHAVSSQ